MRYQGPFHIRIVSAICAWLFAILFAGAHTLQAASPIIIDIDVLPKATPTGMLSLERIDLAFDNGLAQTSVTVNGKLKAHATIRYAGNGALVGQWLVDGRPLQTFNRTLTFGNSITLETADLPPLPVIEPGEHEVSLQFSTPAVAFTLPVIRYTVETAPGVAPLTLVQPADGAVLTRPRRDGLTVSPKSAAGKLTPKTLSFTWNPPVSPLGRLSKGFGTAAYQFNIIAPEDPSRPLISARVSEATYSLPAVLAATLPTSRELRWEVQSIGAGGQILAASEKRRLTLRPASDIELLTPAEGAAIPSPKTLSWRSLRSFDHYEVRAYLNDAVLMNDLAAEKRKVGTSGNRNAAFTASINKLSILLPDFDQAWAEPGIVLYWIVLGIDRNGSIQELSEIGTFHLPPDIASLNRLPKSLLMAGFEIAVDTYQSGTTLEQLAGNGSIRFTRDRAQRQIALEFDNLSVEPFREQTRVRTGTGVNERVIIKETLKGRVTSGRIAQNFTQPLALDLQGYTVSLRSLTLAEGPAGTSGAWADLTLNLTGYADAGGASPARIALAGVPLEPGGDFFAEIGGFSVTALSTTSPTVAGLTLLGGSLIADFSLSRDFTGADGRPVTREAGIFLMGGGARLEAGSLFPVTRPQAIQLAYDAIELRPDGYDGDFTVTGSDTITPVVPADYRVHFTSGSLSIAGGTLQASSILLDGVVELPQSVRSAAGGVPTARFTQLRVFNGALIAPVNVSDLEWGATGGTPFRLSNARGELRLPYGAATDWQNAGIRLTWGTLDSPVRSVNVTAAAPQTTTNVQTATVSGKGKGNTVSENQSQPWSNIPAAEINATIAGDQFDLRVRVAGVSGTLRSSDAYDGMIGDFTARFTPISFTFTDNAVTASRLDGELIVPKPADFKLPFTEATLTGSGEILGPKLIVPNDIALNYWRVKVLLPPPQNAANDAGNEYIRLAQADIASDGAGETATDAPIQLAAASGGKTGTVAEPTTPPPASGAGKGTLTVPSTGSGTTIVPEVKTGVPGTVTEQLPSVRMLTEVSTSGLALSRSYLRITAAQLQFLLDAKYGPVEFDPLELQTLEIGADGQIQTSRLRLLSGRFLRMNFLADSAAALTFEPYTGSAPAPGAALVTLNGNITFPRLGDRHVILAHTASGARADNLTPNGGAYGNPDLIRFEAANLIYHNAYAEGKGQYKEFLGTTQVSALKALYLNGLMMVGADDQGVYERVGLGIGVDPVRAAALYAGGWLGVGAKLGAGAVNLATEGRSTAETEVAKLVGSIAEVAAATPDERPQKLLSVLENSLALAKRIHLDTGGKETDEIGTALALVKLGLGAANTVVSKETEMTDKERLTMFVELFDLAIPVFEKIEVNGAKLSPDVVTALRVLHLGIRSAKLYLTDTDGQFSKNDWLVMTEGVLAIADSLVSDPTERAPLEIIKKVIAAAKSSDTVDEILVAKVASAILSATETVATGPDWTNVRVLTQALFDGIVQTKGMMVEDRAVKVAIKVFDAGAGDGTNFGLEDDDKAVKTVFRVAKRTLEAVDINTPGLDYDTAGRMVRDTYNDLLRNEFNTIVDPPVGPHATLTGLIDAWTRLRGRPLEESTTALQALIHDIGGDVAKMNATSYRAALDEVWIEFTRAQDVPSFHRAVRKLDHRIKAVADLEDGEIEVKVEALKATLDQFITQHYAAMVTAFRTRHTELMGRANSIGTWEEAYRLNKLIESSGKRIDSFADIADLPEALADAEPWCESRFIEGHPYVLGCMGAFTGAVRGRLAAPKAQELSNRIAAVSTPGDLLAARAAMNEHLPLLDETQKKGLGSLLHGKVLGFRDTCVARVRGAADPWDRIAQGRQCTDDLASLAKVYSGLGDNIAWSEDEYNRNLGNTFLSELMKGIADNVALLLANPTVWNLYRLGEAGIAQVGMGIYTGGLLDGKVTVSPESVIVSAALDPSGYANLAIAELQASPSAQTVGAAAYIYYLIDIFLGAPEVLTSEGRILLEGQKQLLIQTLTLLAPQTKSQLLDRIDPSSITSIRSAYDVMLTLGAYRNLAMLPGQSRNDLSGRIGQWARAGRNAPCSAKEQMEWFWTGVESLEPSAKPTFEVERVLIGRRCAPPKSKDEDTEAEADDPEDEKLVFTGGELRKELDGILESKVNEADKREAIAWLIARKIEALTRGFLGDTSEHRVLRTLNKQVTFVIANKQLGKRERIVASLDWMSSVITDFVPGHTIAARKVPKILAGLKSFVQKSGDQKGFREGTLILAGGMVDAFVEKEGDRKLIIGGLTGLFDATQFVTERGGVGAGITVIAVTTGVGAGVALALHDRIIFTGGKFDLASTLSGFGMSADMAQSISGIVDQASTRKAGEIDYANIASTAGLTGDFWQGVAKRVPAVIRIAETVPKLQELYNSMRKAGASPVERLDAMKTLFDIAGDLPLVGPYVRVVANPGRSLLAPDTDQEDYLTNLLLAELGAVRSDNPANRGKAFKSTCPGFTVDQGVQFSGALDANDVFVCAIDMAREALGNHMQGVINPDSLAGQNQRARQAVATMRREAVFAPAIGGENLSGIAGGLEYRNGQFALFELITTFGMKGFFESAATIEYTPSLLTLRQAQSDSRDAGLLGNLGLSRPGINQLLGTDVFNNPIKQLYVQVGGPNACLDMRASLGATTPLGFWQTGEQALRACADPFGLDLNVQFNGGFAVFQSTSTLRLFYVNGNGGLDLGVRVGIDTGWVIPEPVICDAQGRCWYIKWWGAYGNVGIGLGITAGISQLELRGNSSINLGVYVTEKDEPYCNGTSFEPNNFTYANVRYGTCRYNLGLSGDFRIGTTYENFYYKGQTGVDVAVGRLGFWVYRMGDVSDWGTGNFPSDRYGGFVMLDSGAYIALDDGGRDLP